jgi:hypothetical protein
MRFFGGLSLEEIAKVLNVSSRTVLRDWKQAGRCIESDLERIHRQLFPFLRLRARENAPADGASALRVVFRPRSRDAWEGAFLAGFKQAARGPLCVVCAAVSNP